jgi:hypothetical protein
MNKNHWTGYTEQELARMRGNGRVHASRVRPARARVREPDVTAATKAVLDRLGVEPAPAYPPHWLPELVAAKPPTPAEWSRENAPDPHEHRNGTPDPASPASEAYPREWLQGLESAERGGALGGDGWLNRRAA